MPTPPGRQSPDQSPKQYEEFNGSEDYPSESATPAPAPTTEEGRPADAPLSDAKRLPAEGGGPPRKQR